jgi:ubiquinone/menaquinone biosynthesis C-methylase UbiE
MTDEQLLDEIAFAGLEHLDADYAAAYDRKARLDPTEDLDGLRARGLGPASTLIDFGAGTGTFAVAAAAVCRRVIAVDVSPVMVEAIRAKVTESGATNVGCVQAGFLSYEHQGAPPDFIYTRNALHHLPDFWKGIALSRMASLLSAGGILRVRDLVFSFDLTEAEGRIANWLDTAAPRRIQHV